MSASVWRGMRLSTAAPSIVSHIPWATRPWTAPGFSTARTRLREAGPHLLHARQARRFQAQSLIHGSQNIYWPYSSITKDKIDTPSDSHPTKPKPSLIQMGQSGILGFVFQGVDQIFS